MTSRKLWGALAMLPGVVAVAALIGFCGLIFVALGVTLVSEYGWSLVWRLVLVCLGTFAFVATMTLVASLYAWGRDQWRNR